MRIITQNYCSFRPWNPPLIASLYAKADVIVLADDISKLETDFSKTLVQIASKNSTQPFLLFNIKKSVEQLPWQISALGEKHLPVVTLCFPSRCNQQELLCFLQKISQETTPYYPLLSLSYEDIYVLLYQHSSHYDQSSTLTTDFCNLQCNMCMFHSQDYENYLFAQNRRTNRVPQEIEPKIMHSFLDQLRPQSRILFSASGEFLVSDHALDYVRQATKRNLIPMVLTNGVLLNKEIANAFVQAGVTQFIISVDGHQANLYQKHRQGGKFETVVKNIMNLRAFQESSSRHFDININSILFEEFESLQQEIATFWKQKADHLYFLVERIDYCGKPRKLFCNPSPIRMCFEPLVGPLLLSNGFIAPCCSVAIAEWYEDFSWLLHLSDTSLDHAVITYRKMMLDENSPLRQYCEKCHYWSNSMLQKGRSPYWEFHALKS